MGLEGFGDGGAVEIFAKGDGGFGFQTVDDITIRVVGHHTEEFAFLA